MAADLLQTVLSLGFVLGLIFGLGWLTRRLQAARGSRAQALNIEAGVQLGAKEHLVLVNVQGQQFLIGVAPGQVNILKALGAVPPQEPAGSAPPANPNLGEAFAIQLNKLLGR